MRAWKQSDGRYRLEGDPWMRRGETYARRVEIARLGGRWDRAREAWLVTGSAVDSLKADRMYGVVRAPFCHISAGFCWVTEEEVRAGVVRGALCPRCDSRGTGTAIIDVCGESDVARAVYEAEFRAQVEALA